MSSPAEETAISFYQAMIACSGAPIVVRAFIAPRPDVSDLVGDAADVLHHFDALLRANEHDFLEYVPVKRTRRGRPKGTRGRRQLLSRKQVLSIRKAIRAGERYGEIAKAAGVSITTMRRRCGSKRAYAK